MSTKIVQAECKSKRSLRFCRGAAYPSGGSSPQSVHAECKSKLVRGFAEAQPIRAEARPPQSVQAECKSKRSLRFCRGAAYPSGGSSSAKCASRVQKQTEFEVLPRRSLSERRLVLRKVCKPRVEPKAKKAGIRIVSDPIFRPSNNGNETSDPVKGIAGHTDATAGEAPRTEGREPAPQAIVV